MNKCEVAGLTQRVQGFLLHGGLAKRNRSGNVLPKKNDNQSDGNSTREISKVSFDDPNGETLALADDLLCRIPMNELAEP